MTRAVVVQGGPASESRIPPQPSNAQIARFSSMGHLLPFLPLAGAPLRTMECLQSLEVEDVMAAARQALVRVQVPRRHGSLGAI